MDCKIQYPPYVMDFDHRNFLEKEFTISNMFNGGCLKSKYKIFEEIKKCDIVCLNCHRIRTYNRKNFGNQESEVNCGGNDFDSEL